jgi:hypothetical protein
LPFFKNNEKSLHFLIEKMSETLSIIHSPQKKTAIRMALQFYNEIIYFYLKALIPVTSAPVINK